MPDQIDRNLLIFLDPKGETFETEWRFVTWQEQRRLTASSGSEDGETFRMVYCFERKDFIGYILFRWYAKIQGVKGGWRKILYMNDGLLSSMFDSATKVAYRFYSADHLPRPISLRQRLVALLPISLRAEKRYVVMEKKSGVRDESCRVENRDLEGMDFMFFSNAAGKLLLTRSVTMTTGEGTVFKTTANAEYAEVLEREFTTMSGIAGLQGRTSVVPSTSKRIQTRSHTFFTEQYVKGKTLSEIIKGHARKNDDEGFCMYLDRLDRWFLTYSSLFEGAILPISSCYEHLFNAFYSLYGTNQNSPEIMASVQKALDEVSKGHSGVYTIVAHNDLWPGNFIVNGERLIAIDWERATPDRAPFFDYYWMIISAALEYHAGCIGVIDYSKAIHIFLEDEDTVSRQTSEKLSSYLERHALDRKLHRNFLLLFLMELSVQGYLALGRQTDMDRLAFGELLHYFRKKYHRIIE